MQSSKKHDQNVLSVYKLEQQFLNLQQDWESFKKSNPRRGKTLEPVKICLSSETSQDDDDENELSSLVVKTLDLLKQSDSPRSLMSSLQLADSPGRERRATIASGSLKRTRRRLFDLFEDDDEEKNVVCHEVRSVLSFEDVYSNGENDACSGTGDVAGVPGAWLAGQRVMTEESEVKNMENNGKRPQGVVRIIQWFVVFFVVFLIWIFCELNFGESEVYLVPT